MTPTAEEIARDGTILRVQVGSGVYGTGIPDQDDRDEMGICLEPESHVIGLRNFEQYVHRTQPEGVRSGPGDLDLCIYSARKWMSLALKGNPTILLPLFVPDDQVMSVTQAGRDLRTMTETIVSRRAGVAFAGYMRSQMMQLTGEKSKKHTNRPELVEKYGFDTKFAYHMVRLGAQGVELLETGRITLPIPEPLRTELVDLRLGRYTKDDALDAARGYEERLLWLIDRSPLPPHPDEDAANEWLIYAYHDKWFSDRITRVQRGLRASKR